ncbi:MAG: transposase [Pseudonocardia sp.]
MSKPAGLPGVQVPSSPVCTCLSCPVHDRAATTPCPVYPSSSITDAQWAILEPLLAPPGNTGSRGGRPENHPRRQVLDAIFYLVRGGIAWAQLPRDFPPHQSVYGIFRRWARGGAWQGDPRRAG